VDELAKKAIMGGSSNKHELPKYLKKMLPHSKLGMNWAYNKKLKHKKSGRAHHNMER
jgi:hypothetical protein